MLLTLRAARRIALTAAAIALAGCGARTADAPTGTRAPASAAAAAPGAAHHTQDTRGLVKVRLVADVTRVAPGQEFTLAAVFDIAPGWHIYWRNPGDAGLLTAAAFRGPARFQIRPVRYPGPQRFDAAGNIVTYGYRRRVLLSAPVVAPDQLGTAPLTFAVKASWLACREGCVVGHATDKLTLPAATASAPSRPAHAALFAVHRARLPQPLSALSGVKRDWNVAPGEVELVLHVPGTKAARVVNLEFFPAAHARLVGQAAMPEGAGRTLHLMFRAGTAAARGVLRVTAGAKVRYYAVDLAPPAGGKPVTNRDPPEPAKENR